MKYKFRAFNKQTSTMVYLDPLQWPLKALDKSDNWEVMMWTGLTDSQGKEIYGGDILRGNIYGELGTITVEHEIGWEGDGWPVSGFIIEMDYLILGKMRVDDVPIINGEIIGNIWENGDLLNDNK